MTQVSQLHNVGTVLRHQQVMDVLRHIEPLLATGRFEDTSAAIDVLTERSFGWKHDDCPVAGFQRWFDFTARLIKINEDRTRVKYS